MHRNQILGLLKTYRRRYPAESVTVKKISEFVGANSDCFCRELSIGHITGSAWVLDSTGTRVLLTHHKKLNIWVQLGGHADGETDILYVAKREAEEESGLRSIRVVSEELFDIDIHRIPGRGREVSHFHYDCRFLMQADDEDYYVSNESHDLAWISLAEIDTMTDEVSMLRMVEKTTLHQLK